MGFEGYIWISLYYNCLTKTKPFFSAPIRTSIMIPYFFHWFWQLKIPGNGPKSGCSPCFSPMSWGGERPSGDRRHLSVNLHLLCRHLIPADTRLTRKKNPSFCWNWIFRIATAFPFFCHQISAVRTAKIIRLQGTIPLNSLPDNLDILCPRMLIPIA